MDGQMALKIERRQNSPNLSYILPRLSTSATTRFYLSTPPNSRRTTLPQSTHLGRGATMRCDPLQRLCIEQTLDALDTFYSTDIIEQRIKAVDILYVQTDSTFEDTVVALYADSSHIYTKIGSYKFR